MPILSPDAQMIIHDQTKEYNISTLTNFYTNFFTKLQKVFVQFPVSVKPLPSADIISIEPVTILQMSSKL